MESEIGFGSYHPAVCFSLFACAIVLGMFASHPAFLAANVGFAALYYLLLRGLRALRLLGGLFVLFCVITAANPLFNTLGDTVLFTYFGRPYTLEALMWGADTAALLVGMLLWFSCYNLIMTSDKLTALFGRAAPSLSLVFTMVLRLVPTYHRKIDQIAAARAGIGKSPSAGSLASRVESGAGVLSALTSCALEGAVATADSMRARGYGLGRRTSWSRHRFTVRDKVLAGAVALLAAAAAAAIATGAAAASFSPAVSLPPATPAFACGLSAYAALLAVPSAITVRERILWRISLSNI